MNTIQSTRRRQICLGVASTLGTAFTAPIWAQTSASSIGNLAPTSDLEKQAIHVLNRLGYGPRSGDIERVKQMGISNYINAQLHPENIPLPASLTQRLEALSTESASTGEMLGEFEKARKEAKDDTDDGKQKARQIMARITEQTAEARLARAIESPRQLEEVMVEFWFNHFNVFAQKGLVRAFIPSYERDAIRPYVMGNFRDMLGATAKHPAMLFYLDNWLSTSADYDPERARPGIFKRRPPEAKQKSTGLNENYARELMELHTLGVDGGYTQKDVTELARILSGWGFNQRQLVQRNATFTFNDESHDQGTKLWLGVQVPAKGQLEGEVALNVLAMHPSTAKFLSTKLAQFFVNDQPPPALIERLAKVYLANKGEIRPVLAALFSSPEFMAETNIGAKYKTPYQFVISSARATGLPVNNIRPLLGTLAQLGMPLYGCPTPDGYKNTEAAWLNPDAVTRRINFATALASGRLPVDKKLEEGEMMGMGKKQLEKRDEVAKVANMPTQRWRDTALDANGLLATLGSSISPATREIVASNGETLRAALVLGSPDFMRH
jgi:uncharacterized protein (DUF1800 family)